MGAMGDMGAMGVMIDPRERGVRILWENCEHREGWEC